MGRLFWKFLLAFLVSLLIAGAGVGTVVWLHNSGEQERTPPPGGPGGDTLILRETMKDLEKRLDPRKFQRVHRSTIVNLDLVKQVKPHTNGECFLILESGAQVKVSRSYRDVVARFVH